MPRLPGLMKQNRSWPTWVRKRKFFHAHLCSLVQRPSGISLTKGQESTMPTTRSTPLLASRSHVSTSVQSQEIRPKVKREGNANSAVSWEGLDPIGNDRCRETGDKANITLTSSILCRGMVAWEKSTSMAQPHQRELPLQRGSVAVAQRQGYDVS